MQAAREYMRQFVRERFNAGCSVSHVLAEFNLSTEACPQQMQYDEVVEVLLSWVQQNRDQEEIEAAFTSAEYVEFHPAFGDCTGRYVDVHFAGAS